MYINIPKYLQVTYKWLSKELQVHVNVAKQILREFYEKYSKSHNIESTYLLIGILKDNGICVEVVRESALSKAKERFDKIISEHLYSVHKPMKNLELLASSGAGDVTYSAIKCDICTERNDEEMHLLRWGTAFKENTEDNLTNLKLSESVNRSEEDKKLMTTRKNGFDNLFSKTDKQKNSGTSKFIKIDKSKEAVTKNTDFPTNAGGKHQSLVEKSKSESSTQNSKKSKKSSPKTQIAKKVKNGDLGSFFGKVMPPKCADIKVSEVNCNKVTEETSEEKRVKEKETSEEKRVEKKEISEKKQVKEKDNKRGKKRTRRDESNINAKKRKRIVIQSDSSDSEMQTDTEEAVAAEETVTEDEVPAKPKSPSPPRVKHENGKRRVLKLVNKTYKEGEYMVTKKEHVYVSCSEDEEEEEKKKKELLKLATNTEKVKKKQTTLTNFFKRS